MLKFKNSETGEWETVDGNYIKENLKNKEILTIESLKYRHPHSRDFSRELGCLL